MDRKHILNTNNLKQIDLCMIMYEDDYDSFPYVYKTNIDSCFVMGVWKYWLLSLLPYIIQRDSTLRLWIYISGLKKNQNAYQFLMKMLTTDPSDRIKDMRELIEAIIMIKRCIAPDPENVPNTITLKKIDYTMQRKAISSNEVSVGIKIMSIIRGVKNSVGYGKFKSIN